MAEKDGKGDEVKKLLRLPKDNIQAQVPVGSPEYQGYLEANRRTEELREEQGGLNPGDLDNLRDAAQGVSKKAKDIIKGSKSN